jgi:hypothetical protein
VHQKIDLGAMAGIKGIDSTFINDMKNIANKQMFDKDNEIMKFY